MDSIPLDTPQKQCTRCKQSFPATTIFFYSDRSKQDGLSTLCKDCKYVKKRKPYEPKTHKQCKRCKQEKPNTPEFFPRDKRNTDGLRGVCKVCLNRPTRTTIGSPEIEKPCSKCGIAKPATLEYFSALKHGKYGLSSICKVCDSAYYKAHAKEHGETSKRWRQAHKEERRTYNHQYNITHHEAISLAQREYRKTHKKTPEANRARHHKRRAAKMAVGGTYTAQDVQTQYERQKGKCYWCSCKLGKGKRAYHVDHVIPLTRGGSNNPDNIVISCPSCNTSKHNSLPHEWYRGGRLL